MQRPKIICVVGATSTGKSDLAVRIAKKYNGEVISADSRQVYKGLNLGTGKVTKKEMAGIPHHLLNVAAPKTTYTAANYEKDATEALQRILNKSRIPIICGGTGLYIDALLGKLTLPEVPPNKKLRASLSKLPAEKLFKKLQKLDPRRAKEIDQYNPVRLIRAIEIATSLGSVPKLNKYKPRYETLTIGLTLPKEELQKRIHTRLLARMKQGMLREARGLHAKGLSWKRMEELGLEYRYMAKHLQGKISKQEMVERLEKEIVQYARRQVTWFKRDRQIHWLSPTEGEKVLSLVTNFLK